MNAIHILDGDCRAVMGAWAPYDLIIADPPYGQTSLHWDQRVEGWERIALAALKPTGSMWLFGSMRLLMETWPALADAGWKYAQDIVWEKHNGSGFHADRFRRVHEHVVHFYRADASWSGVYNEVQTVNEAKRRTVRKKAKPAHWMGATGPCSYTSEAGGPLLMRSVVEVRSCHRQGIHPTEKPIELLEILIRTSCPLGGLVGDFFAGSGAAGEAAATTGHEYVGAEIDPEMAEKARARLAGSLFAGGR